MRKENDSPDLATETETGRLTWNRPRLERLSARGATGPTPSAITDGKGQDGMS
jgi:hypothetical protein